MMQNQNYEIPLRDIKPLLEIEEYSFYYFLGVSTLIVALACGTLYLLYRWYKNRNRFNIRKEHFRLLSEVDTKDTKKAAYAITFYGATFKDDSPRHVEMFDNLSRRLELFKYKKEVEGFDSEVLGYIDLYRGMIDV